MHLAVLQPVLIPDLHDIALMKAANRVVIQDSEQWSRKGRTHRALIRTPEGTQYLNMPVKTEDRKKPIREVRIEHSESWTDLILRALKYNYSNSVYYDFYEPEIRADITKGKYFEYLMPFSSHLRNRIFTYLEIEIKAEIEYCSELPEYHSDPDRLAKNLEVDAYFQEHDARHYQRQGKNRSDLPFKHPEYRQHFKGFEPYCCLLDLLFQYGPESFRVIDQLGEGL